MITLKNIIQIQPAKAVLAVGIEFLKRKVGVTNLDHTVLTGAFGAKFNWHKTCKNHHLSPLGLI